MINRNGPCTIETEWKNGIFWVGDDLIYGNAWAFLNIPSEKWTEERAIERTALFIDRDNFYINPNVSEEDRYNLKVRWDAYFEKYGEFEKLEREEELKRLDEIYGDIWNDQD